MPGGMVRISGAAKKTLEEMARRSGEPMTSVLDKAVEEYRRRRVLDETNRAYAKLRADKKASSEFDGEIAAWDATLMDGLDGKENWKKGGRKAVREKGPRK